MCFASAPSSAAADGATATPSADLEAGTSRLYSPEFEPPPAPLLPPPLPPSPPPPPRPPVVKPVPPAAPRVVFELGAAGSALVSQGVYGFGGLVEFGARYRLRFGSLGATLRLSLEQHIQPEPAPFLMYLGGAITYVAARPRWRVSPYVGVIAQAMLQRLPDSVGAVAVQRDQGGLVLAGLVGAQLRLGRGGLFMFTELGYRGAVYKPSANAIPAWNTAVVLLGFRFYLD